MRFIGVASASARRQRGVRPAFVLLHVMRPLTGTTAPSPGAASARARAIWDGPSRCLISVAKCAEQHQTKTCGTNELESRPPEEGQRDKFRDAGCIHELPRVAPALPVRRHLTGEFLYGGADEDHADQAASGSPLFSSRSARRMRGIVRTAEGTLVESLVNAISLGGLLGGQGLWPGRLFIGRRTRSRSARYDHSR